MNRDQFKGRVKIMEGKAKDVTGKNFGNKSLGAKGKVQYSVGKIQADYGDLKDDFKEDK